MKRQLVLSVLLSLSVVAFAQGKKNDKNKKDKDDKIENPVKLDKGKNGKKPEAADLYKGQCEMEEVENNQNYTKYVIKSEKGFTELMLFADETFALRRQNDEGDDYLTVGSWKKQGSKKVVLKSDVDMFNTFIDNMPPDAESFIYFEVNSTKWSVKNKGMAICI